MTFGSLQQQFSLGLHLRHAIITLPGLLNLPLNNGNLKRRFIIMTPPVISPTGGWVGTTIFVLVFLAALVLFGIRVGKLIALLAKARPEDRSDHIEDRIGEFFLIVLGQQGVLRDPIPGIAHFFTFWGFIIIQFGLLNFMLGAFKASLPLL